MTASSFRPGQVIRARGETWVVHRHIPGTLGSILEVRGRDRDNLGTRTSFVLPCEPIEHLSGSSTPRVVRPRTWRRIARAWLTTATPSYDALRSPARANLTILPYQLEPVLAIVRGLTSRVLIADEVGLGKTIQAGLVISELLERRPDGRVLIVSPAGLREQWSSELRERFGIEPALLDSAALARHAGVWNANPWSVFPVVVTSLDYVKRPEVVRSLESLVWDVVVFDEAHALSGRSDRAGVATALAHRARTLVLVTATPHSGDEEAFARLSAIGDFPDRFPLLVFRRTRVDIDMPASRRTTSLRVRPTPPEAQMHKALMSYVRLVWPFDPPQGKPFDHPVGKHDTRQAAAGARLAMTVLMRRACSSPFSLARSIETRLQALSFTDGPDLLQIALPFNEGLEDGEPAAELTSPGLQDRREECRHLEHVLHLARAAELSESKLHRLGRLLRRAGEPAIVFTEYRDTLNRVATFLHDLAPVQLHGGLIPEARQEVLRQFTSGSANLLLATDAASEGLNLHQRCRLVINLELPWTPVRLEQRIGRVERLGQTRRVHVVHLLAADTCEESSVATFLARLEKVGRALEGMRGSAAIQQHIADAVIRHESAGDGPDPPLVIRRPLPDGVIVANFRETAQEEASRLMNVRAFADELLTLRLDGRPPVMMVRRRPQPSRCWCAVHLDYEDDEQQPVWDALIGVTGTGGPGSTAAASVRQWFQRSTELMMPALEGEAQNIQRALFSSMQAPLSLALRREHAIANALEARRARLSAGLLQPGLFDRRTERAASAQRAVLNEALGRCAARLDQLTRSGHATTCRYQLAFGLIVR